MLSAGIEIWHILLMLTVLIVFLGIEDQITTVWYNIERLTDGTGNNNPAIKPFHSRSIQRICIGQSISGVDYQSLLVFPLLNASRAEYLAFGEAKVQLD